MRPATEEISETDIAIIGMSCRLPGANDPDSYWDRICEGEELLTVLTDDDLLRAGISSRVLDLPNFVPTTGLIDGYAELDADLFGIAPTEAQMMDPQHRLLLELCWQALEDAGHCPDGHRGDIGVFAGCGPQTYMRFVESHFDEIDYLYGSIRGRQADIGNQPDFLAARVSYRLGLRGPALTVQGACATGLVAVHLACQSLILDETDLALVGVVHLQNPQVNGYIYQEGSSASPDGHVRPFDALANGTVPGNGGAAVVLRRLTDAIADGDHVVAVIKGSATNSDGHRMSFTAPGVAGQAEAIRRALAVAGVSAHEVGFVETHGSGTLLGDSIEIAALAASFDGVPAGSCALGAVKSQIGHLGKAAGIAALIKAALVVNRGHIPACVNHQTLNPHIEQDASPFVVPHTPSPWIGPRYAGVSAYGLAGPYAHVVLAQAPPVEPREPSASRPTVIGLSARTPSALEAMRSELARHLNTRSHLAISDIAHVLSTGRHTLPYRGAVVASDTAEAAQRLEETSWLSIAPAPPAALPTTFLFPGHGAQNMGAGARLYAGDPVFRRTVDDCSEILASRAGPDIRDILLAGSDADVIAVQRMRESPEAQAITFVTEYALATSLMAAGLTPAVMIGHGIGEFAAACLAGVFGVRDALLLVSERARLTQLTEAKLDFGMAALGAAGQTAASGRATAISIAARSGTLGSIVEEFAAIAQRVTYQPATIAIASTLLGTWAQPVTMASPDYWVRHLREEGRFADAARTALEEGPSLLCEVGPGRALTDMYRQLDGGVGMATITPWLPNVREPETAAEIVAQAWSKGGRIDWADHLDQQSLRRVPLPGYAFERSRFWMDEPVDTATATTGSIAGADQRIGVDGHQR